MHFKSIARNVPSPRLQPSTHTHKWLELSREGRAYCDSDEGPSVHFWLMDLPVGEPFVSPVEEYAPPLSLVMVLQSFLILAGDLGMAWIVTVNV